MLEQDRSWFRCSGRLPFMGTLHRSGGQSEPSSGEIWNEGEDDEKVDVSRGNFDGLLT